MNATSAFVFDACALIAYLRDEHVAAEAVDLLVDASGPRSVHSLNLCEVFYDTVRRVGEVAALAEIDDILDLGPVECPDMTREAWKTAG